MLVHGENLGESVLHSETSVEGARQVLVHGEITTGGYKSGDRGGSVVVAVVHWRLLPIGGD